MSLEYELRIHPISSEGDYSADLVFIHGLGGHYKKSWHPPGNEAIFWPQWLAEELKFVKVWSVNYPSIATRWVSRGANMSLQDRARGIISYMVHYGIGENPTVFIVHSLGGLLIKQMLRLGNDMGEPKWQKFVKNTKGIVFIASPHSGTSLATFSTLAKYLSLPTNLIEDLKYDSPLLRELSTWYRQNVKKLGIRTKAFYEQKMTGPVWVVGASTADPGVEDCIPTPVDSDHFSICRPTSKESQVYLETIEFAKSCLQLSDLSFGRRTSFNEIKNNVIELQKTTLEIQERIQIGPNSKSRIDQLHQGLKELIKIVRTFSNENLSQAPSSIRVLEVHLENIQENIEQAVASLASGALARDVDEKKRYLGKSRAYLRKVGEHLEMLSALLQT